VLWLTAAREGLDDHHASAAAGARRDTSAQLRDAFGATELAALSPEAFIGRVADLTERRSELASYLGLRRQRRALEKPGLDAFLQAADAAGAAADELGAMFLTLVARRRAEAVRRSNASLSEQSGTSLEALRASFKQRDRAKLRADRGNVRESLLRASPLPGSDFGPKKDWTEMKLVRNEIAKESRFVPVRNLLARRPLDPGS
jgi:hypothetical protein